MKLKVNSFFLLPPCFLEIFICILRWRATGASCAGSSPGVLTETSQLPKLQQASGSSIKTSTFAAPVRERERTNLLYILKNLLLSCGPKVSREKAWKFVLQLRQWASCVSPGRLNTVTKLSEGHWKRDILSPSHFFCEATHNTKLIKASTRRKRNVPFGKFRNSWLVLSITFVLTSVELIQLSLFMKLSFLCYLIATNCCNYISELQIFCTDKNFDCLSATHKEKITSAKWGVPRLDNNA